MVKTTAITGLFATILLTIIFLLGIFNIVSAGVPQIQSSGDALNDSNLCISSGCFYNTSLTQFCRQDNGSNSSTPCATGQHSAQFSSFYGSNGVIILAIMAMIIVGVISIAFIIVKKK